VRCAAKAFFVDPRRGRAHDGRAGGAVAVMRPCRSLASLPAASGRPCGARRVPARGRG
jgi:hypothetical protein